MPERTAPYIARVSFASATDLSAEDYFNTHISATVQGKCVACHVAGGASGNTRLVFVRGTGAEDRAANFDVIAGFVEDVDGGGELILNKVQGVGHGGGVQVPAGSQAFVHIERFLGLLGEERATAPVTVATLFDAVQMVSHGRTLRRAAIVFAGRNPTSAELTALRSGSLRIRALLRGLMRGKGFHEFLLRGANDRLLTDKHLQLTLDPNYRHFTTLAEAMYQCRRKHGDACWDQRWFKAAQFGFARAPLELVAHVAENDRPYTDVLTANHIMANAFANAMYGGPAEFDDPNDPFEFQPTTIVDYHRPHESQIVEYSEEFGAHVVDPGNLRSDIPLAGMLNTNAFLRRYPSTATNRNRARSRWTYYHFLGLDVEKSAPRTTDPVALADTDNPTLRNPACTVCHSVLDPVAGTYQNYGDDGLFLEKGHDSLDDFYKRPPDGSASPYREGDRWYRDMRAPGFGGKPVSGDDTSLQWLAGRIVADRRFAEAAVRFWWPAVMGVEVASPPEDAGDADFAGRLLAANAQAAEVTRLARGFRRGFGGGRPFNLKDLLVEIALSKWFRAGSVTDDHPLRRIALRNAGAERLLTPEELSRKTLAVTGVEWGRSLGNSRKFQLPSSGLGSADRYRLLYGGIDSDGVTERAGDITVVMSGVAQRHAAIVSRAVALRELYLLADGSRRLLDGVDVAESPMTEAEATGLVEAAWPNTETLVVPGPLTEGAKTIVFTFRNGHYDEEVERGRHISLDRLDVRGPSGSLLSSIEFEELDDYRESGDGRCGDVNASSHYQFYACPGAQLRVSVDIPENGAYVEVVVGGEQYQGLPELHVAVDSPAILPVHAAEIRRKLAELHGKMLGVTVAEDSVDVIEAFALFEEVMQRKRMAAEPPFMCRWPLGVCPYTDHRFFHGVVDDATLARVIVEDQEGWMHLDGEVANEVIGGMADPHYVAQSWAVVLAFLMTDYRYLYL